jgi:hypothetical protein
MTLSDLQRRMSQDELQTWVAYVEENGPLNPSLRLEAAVARAISPFLKNTKPADMMLWPRKQEPIATPETTFLMFKNLATASRKNH